MEQKASSAGYDVKDSPGDSQRGKERRNRFFDQLCRILKAASFDVGSSLLVGLWPIQSVFIYVYARDPAVLATGEVQQQPTSYSQMKNTTYPLTLRITAFLSAIFFGSGLVQAADGFGRNATGGAGGATVTVTTAAQLRQYAESTTTYNINVSGTIDLGSSGRVNVKGNKTIHGTSTSATIKGTLNIENVSNIIIDHLNITANTGSAGANDGITINNSRNIFITKCNIYDCTDGALDHRTGARDVTVSWCRFYYTRDNGHNFVNLIGSSDTDTPTGGITFHHNWWSTLCKQRMPADRFGQVHMYNNYFNCSGNSYCSNARNVGQILSQNNYYQSVKDPCYKEQSGKLRVSGNTYARCTGKQFTTQDSVFTPNYGYTLDATANVPSRVQGGAGNR
jgi:pectate lyase